MKFPLNFVWWIVQFEPSWVKLWVICFAVSFQPHLSIHHYLINLNGPKYVCTFGEPLWDSFVSFEMQFTFLPLQSIQFGHLEIKSKNRLIHSNNSIILKINLSLNRNVTNRQNNGIKGRGREREREKKVNMCESAK